MPERAEFDLAAARAATPGCHRVAFLNNAGAALPTQETLDAVIGHLRLEAGIGGYAAAERVAERLAGARAAAARLVNVEAEEIALAGSDSQAWTKAFWGFVIRGGLRAGDRVVVDRLSYSSHYLALLQVRQLVEIEIVVVPSTAAGALDLGAMAGALDGAALVTATHVGTNCGLVNPVAAVGQLARSAGVPFFLDACQSVGQLPLDIAAVGCDVATMTGRKFLRAPRATGVLFVRRDFVERIDPPGIDSGAASWIDAERYALPASSARFEEFEMSVAAQVGLASALDQALALGIDQVHARVSHLAERLRTGLSALDGVHVDDGEGERSAITTFRVDRAEPAAVVRAAADAGITVTVSNAPWARLDMAARGLDEVVRASPHCYNTDDEVDRLVDLVAGLG